MPGGGMNEGFRRAAALLLFLAAPSLGAAGRLSFEDLLANLKSPNAKTRQEAAEALGKSRRREAVAHLAPLVHDPEMKVRMEVVKALRQLREPAAVPALVTSLRDGDLGIREEAIGTLVELYSDRERASAVGRFLDLFSDEFDRSSIAPHAVVDPSVIQGLTRTRRSAAWPSRVWAGSPARPSSTRSRRITSARRTTRCAWPTRSPSRAWAIGLSSTASSASCLRARSAPARATTCSRWATASSESCIPISRIPTPTCGPCSATSSVPSATPARSRS